jgi:hypothetical protein
MKVVVFGSGLQGSACALDLLSTTDATVTLADRSPDQLWPADRRDDAKGRRPRHGLPARFVEQVFRFVQILLDRFHAKAAVALSLAAVATLGSALAWLTVNPYPPIAEFGGGGASILDITDMCYALGRACASTAMIFAMHQTKVACLIRHGTGSAWHEMLMRRVASEQLLLASSTTEGQNGGNVRSSAASRLVHGRTGAVIEALPHSKLVRGTS